MALPANDHGRIRSVTEERQRQLLSCVVQAHHILETVQHGGSESDVADARRRLQLSVEAVRDSGVQWSEIGDALGIRRGNAYQRFRIRTDD